MLVLKPAGASKSALASVAAMLPCPSCDASAKERLEQAYFVKGSKQVIGANVAMLSIILENPFNRGMQSSTARCRECAHSRFLKVLVERVQQKMTEPNVATWQAILPSGCEACMKLVKFCRRRNDGGQIKGSSSGSGAGGVRKKLGKGQLRGTGSNEMGGGKGGGDAACDSIEACVKKNVANMT